jgi:hypothetical protein
MGIDIDDIDDEEIHIENGRAMATDDNEPRQVITMDDIIKYSKPDKEVKEFKESIFDKVDDSNTEIYINGSRQTNDSVLTLYIK